MGMDWWSKCKLYSLKTRYKAIQIVSNVQVSEVFKQLWSLKVSPATLHFVGKHYWRESQLWKNLQKRGIALSGNLCALCLEYLETTNHLFLTYRVTQTI